MAAWSPTSFFNRRAYGPENFSPVPQKDFCNSICQQETSRDLATATTGREVVSSTVIIGNDRAETFPALTLKSHHLKLLVDAVVGWRGIDHHARKQQVELDVL